MTLTQVWGVLLIFTLCPVLGALPLIDWITFSLTKKKLARRGTGNLSVSAAFYHGGRLVGLLAVLSEAGKGMAAVLLARQFFPPQSEWEIVALMALVMGRYWGGKGAGTTNVTWGIVAHDFWVAAFAFIIGGIGFTIFRERRQGRNSMLVILPLVVALLHSNQGERIGATIALCTLLYWIYRRIPDDLDLSPVAGQPSTRTLFRFFRADKALVSLHQPLEASRTGQKAAILSQLHRWGYPVPQGWVLLPGDDPEPLILSLQPSAQQPLVVRSSAIGEDSEQASAAGQYESILHVTSREELEEAINRCLASYDRPGAIQYRTDRGVGESAMAVVVQQQVQGVFSGVAFSRDPIARHGEAVAIEALPGEATRVVSGQVTPERYRVFVPEGAIDATTPLSDFSELPLWEIEGEPGDLPPTLLRHVAAFARQLEYRYGQVPQDLEWSYDGRQFWILQCRPITTLLPIWTRKIAAEVIPGAICPLTWSINRPLTCGVWGEIFTLVLGDRTRHLDFEETATLHYSHAYFNASLLGEIFQRMGLPPESLDFLTRGSRLSKPSWRSTLRNVPGLLRLARRQWNLGQDFRKDYRQVFAPLLDQLNANPAENISAKLIDPLQSKTQLLHRIEQILQALKLATYYNILSPLSLAISKAILKVNDPELDNRLMPEVAVLRSVQKLAVAARYLLPELAETSGSPRPKNAAVLFAKLAEMTDSHRILGGFEELLDRYGYLSDVGTDIAVPTWKEEPHALREIFAEFVWNPPPETPPPQSQRWQAQRVQNFVRLKGKVTEVYSQLLAQLRWSFVALEQIGLQDGIFDRQGDIFFLTFDEVRRFVTEIDRQWIEDLSAFVERRRSQLERDRQLEIVPEVVYGTAPAIAFSKMSSFPPKSILQGIGASAGQVEGIVKILRSWQSIAEIDRLTILVVPYTDSGWAPLLARAGGLIAEVGGCLSHGAIVAREYGIPAVMDIAQATRRLRDGQRVRVDGERGIVEILDV
jgi:phosphohistidine swiveling domain-containing protein/glycerol-3-phosphate acyltransferase PlsY